MSSELERLNVKVPANSSIYRSEFFVLHLTFSAMALGQRRTIFNKFKLGKNDQAIGMGYKHCSLTF